MISVAQGGAFDHWRASIVSIEDNKERTIEAKNLGMLMKGVRDSVLKKELEDRKFPIPVKEEPSLIVLPNGS